MLPAGVRYIDAWLTLDRTKCFQLMAAERRELLDQWTVRWRDLVDFEIVPVADAPARTAGGAADPH